MIHLIHGIHDGGVSPVEGLIPYLSAAGFEVRYPNYGFILGLETRIANPIIVGSILPYVGFDDILIGHSNGCAIAYDLIQRGAKAVGAVFINGALEQNIQRNIPWIDVYYNAGDQITEVAKVGAKIGLTDTTWGQLGHAGYSGTDQAITNINCGLTHAMPTVWGHSDFFTPANLAAWAPYLIDRIHAHIARSLHSEAYA